ncbi:TPA: hypothetical protein ACGS08_002842 [Pseudomonas aeruginosa]
MQVNLGGLSTNGWKIILAGISGQFRQHAGTLFGIDASSII